MVQTRGKTAKKRKAESEEEESEEEFQPQKGKAKGRGGRGKKKSEDEESTPKKQKRAPKKAQEAKGDKKATKSQTKGESTKEEAHEEKKHHKEEEPKAEILEKGLIYFFYRPKVGVTEAEGIDDVQRMYILLWPSAPSIQKDVQEMQRDEGQKGSNVERLLVVAKKKLPDTEKHEKFFAFVSKVSKKVEDVAHKLDAENYTTKTRGERHIEGARPVGEGVYGLVRYHDHAHLAYVLEMPEEPTEVQKAFNIEKEGSFVVQVKNPDVPGTQVAFLSPKDKASYPEELKDAFKSKKTGKILKFATCDPVQLLDYDGTELILIGASDDLKEELGEVGEYMEELEKVDARKIKDDTLWKQLHMSKKEHPGQALIQGKWV